jgi:two-component system phosphate regulon response regulator PhoB
VDAARRILIVDPDPDARQKIADSLAARRFTCAGVGTARAALDEVSRQRPDLIVLDLAVPDVSGLGLCRILRETPGVDRVPIVVVTSQASEIERVLAFEAGADDFLAKPFYAPELAARVSAVLRGFDAAARGSDGQPASPRIQVDVERGRAEVAGERLDLTPTELRILAMLVARAGRVVRRRELIERLWGPDAPQSDRAIDAHVKSIRSKLGPARDLLETVRGVGYRLTEL